MSTKSNQVIHVPIDSLTPNPKQHRQVFDEEALKQLAQSIQEHGLIQPIVVEIRGGKERDLIIAGERRWRACKMLGWNVIPAVAHYGLDNEQRAVLAAVENLQRENINTVEEAKIVQELVASGLSVTAISRKLGRSMNWVETRVKVFELDEKTAEYVANGTVPHDKKVIEALLSVPEEIRAPLLNNLSRNSPTAHKRGLSVNSVMKAVSILHEKNKDHAIFVPLEHKPAASGPALVIVPEAKVELPAWLVASVDETCHRCSWFKEGATSVCPNCPVVGVVRNSLIAHRKGAKA